MEHCSKPRSKKVSDTNSFTSNKFLFQAITYKLMGSFPTGFFSALTPRNPRTGFDNTAGNKVALTCLTFVCVFYFFYISGRTSTMPCFLLLGEEFPFFFHTLCLVNHLWHSTRRVCYRISEQSSRAVWPCVRMADVVSLSVSLNSGSFIKKKEKSTTASMLNSGSLLYIMQGSAFKWLTGCPSRTLQLRHGEATKNSHVLQRTTGIWGHFCRMRVCASQTFFSPASD